jgi:hypothetical protein
VTIFVIGGLLILALLAILGAVFLSVADQRAEVAQTNGSVTVSTPGAIPLVEQSSTANRAMERTTSQRQNLPSTAEIPLSTTAGGQQQYALNGQYHELTVELQTLYQHAWELERRLRTLAEVADRIEKTHHDEIGSEEEIHSQSSADSTP